MSSRLKSSSGQFCASVKNKGKFSTSNCY
ncbi:unnamed protein product [Larinioides sclopetarius]|uniref:Ribosomal protein L32 n=1 Tax=Larinioides sclopetarius TaxID=280406 RepID=A0AAV1YQM8_9ARAC